MFAEIELLVLEGDAAALAAKVSELSTRLRGAGAPDTRRAAGAGHGEQPAPSR